MSTSRFFNVFVVLALVVLAVLTLRAGIATSEVVSSSKAALDQHERHPASVVENYARGALDQQDRHPSLSAAEQARLAYHSGEWKAGLNLYAPLDAHERHTMAIDAAEQARLEYRRGEWNAGSSTGTAGFDVEQARIQWREGK